MEYMMSNPPKRIVRFSYLIQATGLSRGTVYREMERNPEFPKKIVLGIRAIGFDADEVDAFVKKLIERGTI
jgi:prophage regulatory protein